MSSKQPDGCTVQYSSCWWLSLLPAWDWPLLAELTRVSSRLQAAVPWHSWHTQHKILHLTLLYLLPSLYHQQAISVQFQISQGTKLSPRPGQDADSRRTDSQWQDPGSATQSGRSGPGQGGVQSNHRGDHWTQEETSRLWVPSGARLIKRVTTLS